MTLQYAVFVGSTRGGKWARTTNKRRAIACAKRNGGTVRAMPNDSMTYDAPTFYVLSEQIYPLEVITND